MSELTVHNAVLEQIKTCRQLSSQQDELDDASCNIMRGSQSSTASWRRHTIDTSSLLKKRKSKTAQSQSSSSLTSYTPYASLHPMSDYESVDGIADRQSPAAQKNAGVMLSGWLYKTIRKQTKVFTRMPHEHRQHRKFKLTEHSLEYNHLLQRVNVHKQIPLTSIQRIDYDENTNLIGFKLVFKKSEMLLEAPHQESCKRWVDKITEEWQKWQDLNFTVPRKHFTLNLSKILDDVTTPVGDVDTCLTYLKENQDQFRRARNLEESMAFAPAKSSEEHYNENQYQSFRRPSSEVGSSVKQRTHNILRRLHGRNGLARRHQRSSQKHVADGKYDFTLLHKNNYVMMKYTRNGRSRPHQRIFKIDSQDLMITWQKTETSKLDQSQALLTEHIVDVREGQQSNGFHRYSFNTDKKDQSFSIFVEEEKQMSTLPGQKKTYAMLQSLDLICESEEEQKLWLDKLSTFITPNSQLFCSRYKSTDPTILWLMTWWTILNDDDVVKESSSLSFARSIVPQMFYPKILDCLRKAYQYQFEETEQQHANSLCWDGFVLFFNLLCEVDHSDCQLLKIFREYTKQYPLLGMTVEEFRKFLIEQQQWSPETTTNERCVQIIAHYDYDHKAFKKYQAKAKPFEYHMSRHLLSFSGFISFLRSPENSVINKEHEGVYQDMDHPLSHYFINSSHNTYLEGHQIVGKSTTDAYVRALLQGYRCLELDCWDGPNGEPKITHGHTLVSDLSLREVAKTIDKYAFNMSIYPLILSLENHCSKEQQRRMAQIFNEVFGEKLVKETLTEGEQLGELPSPHELQGKIILKGKVKSSDSRGSSSAQSTRSKGSVENEQQPRRSSELAACTDNQFIFPLTFQDRHLVLSSNRWRIAQNYLESLNKYDKEEEVGEEVVNEDLNRLIVYCRSKRISPWKWEEQQNTSVCQMFSFNDSTALKRCECPTELLTCTKRQFVRTYPSGMKIDSSNYDPVPLWNAGIQMVALNIQTPDDHMFLNQGKFRQNGGCGYILKPEVMRNPTKSGYTPCTKEPLATVTPINLEITLLSGQHLVVPYKKTTTMVIRYETCGIPHDCEKKSFTITKNKTNPLWPQFKNAAQIEKTILMPELCLVLFTVNINVRRKFMGSKTVLLGQNAFPITSIKPGVRFIPLRTPGGKSMSHIGIYVKIDMKRLSHRIASSSGICPQDFDSTPRKLSAPAIPEICPFEDAFSDGDELPQCAEENTTSQPNPTNTEHTPHGRRLMHQTAVVEIHVNPAVDDDVGENTEM